MPLPLPKNSLNPPLPSRISSAFVIVKLFVDFCLVIFVVFTLIFYFKYLPHSQTSSFVKFGKSGIVAGYPPYPYPGTPQQPPFQHGVFPPQSADEVRLRQESTIRQGIANNVTVISRTYHRRSCTYRLARLGIAFLVVGISLLIMLGVIVIRPTLNDMQLQSSRCTVISSEYTQEDMSCDCGRYCTSYYPCLQIQVFYFAKGKRQIAYLYQDVYDDKNKVRIFFISCGALIWVDFFLRTWLGL